MNAILPFSTSYICEAAFSSTNAIKTKNRSQLKNLEDDMKENTCLIHKMVYTFNSNELQNILRSLSNQIKYGNKEYLRYQLLYLLTSSGSFQRYNIEKKIMEVYTSRSTQPQNQLALFNQINRPLRPNLIQHIPIIPDETIPFAHNLPYFKTLAPVLRPMYYDFNDFINADFTNFTACYYLTEMAKNSIIESWNNNKEYKLQILLRLEQIGEKSFNGSLPHNITVFVNDRQYTLPILNVPKLGQITSWQHYVPIDINEYMDLRTCLQNTLKIVWSNKPYSYLTSVFVVQNLTWQHLLVELKKRPIRTSEITLKFIEKFMSKRVGFNLDSVFITIMDPLTKLRLKLPARGVKCVHLQCFDAISFLQINEQKLIWSCPICNKQMVLGLKQKLILLAFSSKSKRKNCESLIILLDN
ncbi:E3 SUMO-protein ligase PIAS2-like [Rhopalosiphum padi]|uniref:E3 SUMO-protein ligase PIAS2-like n=1 Tax=Rhopalosiphum padi TaxID=40932 RepID=UPI00298E707B|nr:E3 SUMO-protein ligase PIAS2-like [Rhopalosiphum padi]